jgi:hypothetical protein
MSSHVRWKDVRAEYVERAGGEEAVEAGKRELMASMLQPEPGTTEQVLVVPGELDRGGWDAAGQEVGEQGRQGVRVDGLGG